MIKITQSKDGNGNGKKEYDPEVVFRYLDSDVYIKENSDGTEEVVYEEELVDSLGGSEKSPEN